MENFEDTINQILVVAAIVSIIVGVIKDGAGGLIEGMSIVIALIIIIVVNSANNYSSERKLHKLMAISEHQTVAVYRDGPIPRTVDITQLVVGDVYRVETGMNVPADSILIQADKISCD